MIDFKNRFKIRDLVSLKGSLEEQGIKIVKKKHPSRKGGVACAVFDEDTDKPKRIEIYGKHEERYLKHEALHVLFPKKSESEIVEMERNYPEWLIAMELRKRGKWN